MKIAICPQLCLTAASRRIAKESALGQILAAARKTPFRRVNLIVVSKTLLGIVSERAKALRHSDMGRRRKAINPIRIRTLPPHPTLSPRSLHCQITRHPKSKERLSTQTVIPLLSPPSQRDLKSDGTLPCLPAVAMQANPPVRQNGDIDFNAADPPPRNQLVVKRNQPTRLLREKVKKNHIYIQSSKGAPPYQPMTTRKYVLTLRVIKRKLNRMVFHSNEDGTEDQQWGHTAEGVTTLYVKDVWELLNKNSLILRQAKAMYPQIKWIDCWLTMSGFNICRIPEWVAWAHGQAKHAFLRGIRRIMSPPRTIWF